jgi:hypothetical protein
MGRPDRALKKDLTLDWAARPGPEAQPQYGGSDTVNEMARSPNLFSKGLPGW